MADTNSFIIAGTLTQTRVTLTQLDADSIRVDVQVIPVGPNNAIGDLRYLNLSVVNEALLAGLSFVSLDGGVSHNFRKVANSIDDIPGPSTAYDIGIEFGTNGIGGTPPDDFQSASFIINSTSAISFADFAGFGIRLTSVTNSDGNRTQSDWGTEIIDLIDLSGTKYLDANGDGETAGDSGLSGVTVYIDMDNSNTFTNGDISATTGSDGAWSFTGLGTNVIGKKVLEVLPSGYVQTLGTAGYVISGDAAGLNFANFELFDISGTKYLDANGDGSTSGDSGLGNVTIFIDVNKNGTYDAGTDQATTTAQDGSWAFSDLDSTYAGLKVYEVLPNGYVQTLGSAGYTITGTSGTDQNGLDFANFLPDPSIDLEKSVKTNLFGFLAEDGDDDPNGLLAATNSVVTFKVVVTNDGNETIASVKLTDSVAHTVNDVQTSQTIVYTPDGNAATLDAFDVFIDLNNNAVQEAGEAWSNFDTNGDGVIDAGAMAELSPSESFTLYYSLNSALGQHENTARIEGTSAISATKVSDADDANYYVLPAEECVGVRTPGFWQNLNNGGQFWDGIAGNEKNAGKPGFADGDLLYAVDSNKNGSVGAGDAAGLLIGDYNMNGITDGGEDTIFMTLADAKTLINASNKQTADGIFMLGRDVVATWLNYLANNQETVGECIGNVANDGKSTPREYLDAAIDWFQQFASTQNGSTAAQNLSNSYHDGNAQRTFQFDSKITPSSSAWQNPFVVGEDIPFSAAQIHSKLDAYNNTGVIDGHEYCCDADSSVAMTALSQLNIMF